MYVGVLSSAMLQLIQLGDSSLCGDVTSWEIGKMYDVTKTGGCSALGLNIRNSEHILIKVEQHHYSSRFILLSEMKSDPQRFNDQVTHFTPKLKQCDTEPVRWVKRHSAIATTSALRSVCSSLHAATTSLMVLVGVIFSIILY